MQNKIYLSTAILQQISFTNKSINLTEKLVKKLHNKYNILSFKMFPSKFVSRIKTMLARRCSLNYGALHEENVKRKILQ